MLKPLSARKWNPALAAHLLNRAGFGGPPLALEELTHLGHTRAVSWLVDYESIPDSTPNPAWARPDPDRVAKLMALRRLPLKQRQQAQREEQRLEQQRMVELRGWWLERMAKSWRPFQEKMTLFWHGHFATSFTKVRGAYYMWRQNDLFRRLATGNWLELLTETGKDPAMLIWLDQAQSRRPHANENFARELMELFSLGIGHYTEKDVTEGARALTGWSLDRRHQRFLYRPGFHDEGIKTFLGRTGNLKPEDVIEQIVAQPQAAVFITGKIWNFFAGQPPSPALNAALADVLRASGNNFKPLMRAIFFCEEFYSPDVVRNQIKSPVDWLVGSVRRLETELPPAPMAGAMLRLLGQDLFAPPNVKGWDGGLAWITTNTLFNRCNQAAVLINGAFVPAPGAPAQKPNGTAQPRHPIRRVHVGGVDLNKILTAGDRASKDALIAALEKRLLQSSLSPSQNKALREFLDTTRALTEPEIRGAIRLVMSAPEYQLA